MVGTVGKLGRGRWPGQLVRLPTTQGSSPGELRVAAERGCLSWFSPIHNRYATFTYWLFAGGRFPAHKLFAGGA